MFNWFRKKKGKANGKQLNKDTSDSGAFIPIILTSDSADEDKNQSGKSETTSNDYSYSASFDSSDSGGGGGD